MSSAPPALPQILDAENPTTAIVPVATEAPRTRGARDKAAERSHRRTLERAVRAARSARQDQTAPVIAAPRSESRARALSSFSVLALVATVAIGFSTVGLGMGAGAVTTDVDSGALTTMAATLEADAAAGDLVSADGAQTLEVTAVDQSSEKRSGFETLSAAQAGYTSTVPCAISADGTIRWPLLVGCQPSSGFGYRIDPSYGGTAFHAGLDLTPGAGSTIVSMADGVVTAVGYFGGYGYRVEISHPELGVTTLYGHMIDGSSPLKVGQHVEIGDKIGLVGSTGKVTGAHLHFEVHVDGSAVDPLAWLNARI